MSVRIQYMGNKQPIAAEVASIVAELRPERPLLDLFCGMCSVAGAVSSSGRAVWGNDVQRYAAHAARCLIATEQPPPDPGPTTNLLRVAIDRNADRLYARFDREIADERTILDKPSVDAYQSAYRGWRHAANDSKVATEVAAQSARPKTVPYRLATLTFAWGYFGLVQSIAIDSLRYAIDRHTASGDLTAAERRWALLALLQAASRLATGPGHTAQYLAADNPASLERVVRQRRRDLVSQFEIELGSLTPYGDPSWRARNRVLCRDADQIWPELARLGLNHAVIYADPPYSKNQYSRFYHVLETLQRYDYPQAHGRGRYRPDRFSTPYSSRLRVAAAFDRMCAGAAALDCALVLSYPANGLLVRHGKGDIAEIMHRHFPKVDLALSVTAEHSTLGARHGQRTAPTTELVYVGAQ